MRPICARDVAAQILFGWIIDQGLLQYLAHILFFKKWLFVGIMMIDDLGQHQSRECAQKDGIGSLLAQATLQVRAKLPRHRAQFVDGIQVAAYPAFKDGIGNAIAQVRIGGTKQREQFRGQVR